MERKERYFFYNTLSGLVKGLENRYTIIDLRNETCVSGLIRSVDGFMNVEMENAIFYDARGTRYKFTNFFVKKRNIRYVHIPDDMSIAGAFDKCFNSMSGRRNVLDKERKEHTFKKKRAQTYHQSVVRDAYSNRDQPGPSRL